MKTNIWKEMIGGVPFFDSLSSEMLFRLIKNQLKAMSSDGLRKRWSAPDGTPFFLPKMSWRQLYCNMSRMLTNDTATGVSRQGCQLESIPAR